MTMTPQIGKNGLLNGQKVPFWRAIVSALCYFIFYFAVQLATEVVYVIYLHLTLPLDGLSEEAYDKMIEDAYFRDGNYLMITIDVVLFLLLAIVFLARGKTFAEGMGMKKTKISSVPLAFVAGLGLTSALFFVMIVVESLFPAIMEDYGNTMDASYNMEQLIAFIFAGVIGAPLIEELIFRHLVTGRLSRGLPRIVAILIGSALFGIIHGHWIQWIYAGVLGFVMACLYFAYDSIWVTIAMHAGFNSLSVISYVQSMMKTEAQQEIFGICLVMGMVACVLFGTIALVHLFTSRPYSVFKKPAVAPANVASANPETSAASAAASAAAIAAKPMQSIYTPYEGNSVMTVAEFTAMRAESDQTAPASAASAPLEEVSNADEAGGNL